MTCCFSPAGEPNGMCGGPGSPIGVPLYVIPYCGAVTPATMFGGLFAGPMGPPFGPQGIPLASTNPPCIIPAIP